MQLLYVVIGIVVGGLVVLLLKSRAQGKDKEEIATLKERELSLKSSVTKAEDEASKSQKERETLLAENAKLGSENKNLTDKLEDQKKELKEMQDKLAEQFENIASRIMNNNSKMMQEQNKEKLHDILSPFKEKIEKFEKKVEDTHKETLLKNQSLKEQIDNLQKLNLNIGEEARNLAKALKGESKTQGNWGEYILETILEKSGLQMGMQYTVQESKVDQEGRRKQPDVVVNLPDNKCIVIDSKVSLVDYERMVNAENEDERQIHLKSHLRSIKQHIKDLSDKNYSDLYNGSSPDFVLMFIPIEPAFNEAVREDQGMYDNAFEKNIVIVSTSTLLATLKTIASIWKQENQTRNAMEIAKQSGNLYDKFKGFVDDLISVGTKLDSAKSSYEGAMNKLSTGKGNLVSRVEKIKDLGAKADKSLPKNLLDKALEDKS
jgi:DNA recombination protein RmuC